MNCPVCCSADNRIIRKEQLPKGDRRRHECVCGVRWTMMSRLEPGSVDVHKQSTLPLLIALETRLVAPNPQANTATNSAPNVSGSGSDPESDPSLSLSEISNRGRARSTHGAEFERLLAVFSQRWQRSYRRPYPVTSADRAQFGRFMREHANYLENFPAMCERYLSDRQQFLITRSSGHTLRWLVTSGLAMYGGTPRESAEQIAARFRKEHEARKRQGPSRSPEIRALVANLANGKAVS